MVSGVSRRDAFPKESFGSAEPCTKLALPCTVHPSTSLRVTGFLFLKTDG